MAGSLMNIKSRIVNKISKLHSKPRVYAQLSGKSKSGNKKATSRLKEPGRKSFFVPHNETVAQSKRG
jgi:hypothetical protein